MKLLLIFELLIYLYVCKAERKYFKIESNETVTCSVCHNVMECSKDLESIPKESSPKWIREGRHGSPGQQRFAYCMLNFIRWNDCRDGPNQDGLVVVKRELIVSSTDPAIFGLDKGSTSHCDKERQECVCTEDLCNLELSTIFPCDLRKRYPGKDVRCPEEGTTIPRWSNLQNEEKEKNEKCSNAKIECYSCSGCESPKDEATHQVYYGEGPFRACIANFRNFTGKTSGKVITQVMSRMSATTRHSADRVNKCICTKIVKGDCTNIECSCYGEKCNNWETLPCVPQKENEDEEARCKI